MTQKTVNTLLGIIRRYRKKHTEFNTNYSDKELAEIVMIVMHEYRIFPVKDEDVIYYFRIIFDNRRKKQILFTNKDHVLYETIYKCQEKIKVEKIDAYTRKFRAAIRNFD